MGCRAISALHPFLMSSPLIAEIHGPFPDLLIDHSLLAFLCRDPGLRHERASW